MRLADLLVDEGRRLFKLRSLIPLALLPVVFLAVPQSAAAEQWLGPRANMLVQWAAIAFGLAGLVMRCWVVGYAPDGTSARDTRGMRANLLNSTGVYSIVRHPLYLANGLLWLGAVMSARVWWSPVIAGLAYWIYIERVMLGEEAFLDQTFGESFRTWAAVTPAIVPAPSHWRPMVGARWQWKRMSSEHNALLALSASVLLFDYLAHWWAGSAAFAPFYAQHPDLVWFFGASATLSVIAIIARRLPSNR